MSATTPHSQTYACSVEPASRTHTCAIAARAVLLLDSACMRSCCGVVAADALLVRSGHMRGRFRKCAEVDFLSRCEAKGLLPSGSFCCCARLSKWCALCSRYDANDSHVKVRRIASLCVLPSRACTISCSHCTHAVPLMCILAHPI